MQSILFIVSEIILWRIEKWSAFRTWLYIWYYDTHLACSYRFALKFRFFFCDFIRFKFECQFKTNNFFILEHKIISFLFSLNILNFNSQFPLNFYVWTTLKTGFWAMRADSDNRSLARECDKLLFVYQVSVVCMCVASISKHIYRTVSVFVRFALFWTQIKRDGRERKYLCVCVCASAIDGVCDSVHLECCCFFPLTEYICKLFNGRISNFTQKWKLSNSIDYHSNIAIHFECNNCL